MELLLPPSEMAVKLSEAEERVTAGVRGAVLGEPLQPATKSTARKESELASFDDTG